jgi:hypothetical protein
MGSRSMDATDWAKYETFAAGKRAAADYRAAYAARKINPYLDPQNFFMRESRSSVANPNPTPIIIALDNSGSMGQYAKELAEAGLGKFLRETFDRKPVTDPHIMFQVFGDVKCDRAPLQASQFEADMTMADQLDLIFLEGGGGNNKFESYNLPWHFANFHTSCDAFERDDRKGFLFTIGDEEAPDNLTREDLDKTYGKDRQEIVMSNEDLLMSLSGKYEVYHIMLEQGSYMRSRRNQVIESWGNLLGQNAIPLSDSTKLAEVLVSLMQMKAGKSTEEVVDSWKESSTRSVVLKATNNLRPDAVRDGLITF